MWDSLGFSKNPYDAAPLRTLEDDVDLLIGRQDESIKFQTIIESVPRDCATFGIAWSGQD